MTDEEFDAEFKQAMEGLGEEPPKALEGGFPNVTSQEIGLYLKVLAEVGDKVHSKQIESHPLVEFLVAVGKASQESQPFRALIGQLKMMLVMANRTTGLTNAYISGVAIGYFLAKPESLPSEGSTGSDSVM